MATMSPGDALAQIERALRRLIELAIPDRPIENWLKARLGDERVERMRQRQEDDRRRRPGAALAPDSLLSYTEYYELCDLIERDWHLFSAALGKKSRINPQLREVERLRNAVSHSRELLPFERDILSGISGKIRNLVVRYESAMDERGNYYPALDYIRDSLGNEAESNAGSATITNCVLTIGTRLEFEVAATDPQGRDINWEIHYAFNRTEAGRCASGEVMRFGWEVREGDVSDQTDIRFVMRSTGEFHRYGDHDQLHDMRYRVLPPR